MTALDGPPAGWSTLDAAGVGVDVFAARGPSPRPLAVVTAGVHGDEYEGPAAVADFARTLAPAELVGSVVAVPVVNPTAFAAGTRTNPEDGKNLARAFPGDPAGSFTDRLAAAVFARLVAEADVVVDLHSGGVNCVFHPLAGFYGDAAASNPSFRAAARFGLDTLWRLPETPGVLSYEAWRRGAVAVGAEYLGAGQLSPAGRAAYLAGVRSTLAACGVLAGRPAPAGGRVVEGDWVTATAAGLFVPACGLNEAVARGRHLGGVYDARGRESERFTAREDGVVLGLRSKASVAAGEWAVFVGRPAGVFDG